MKSTPWEDCPDDLKMVLGAAVLDEPSSEEVSKLAARVAAGPASATLPSASLTSKVILKIVLGVPGAGALVAVGLYLASERAPGALLVHPKARSELKAPRVAQPPVEAGAPSVLLTQTAAPLPTPKANEASVQDTLSQEAQLLERASAALTANDAQTAQRLVTLHKRRFAHGVLAEERDAIRVRALVQAARLDEAEQEFGRFRETYRASSYRVVLENLLAQQPR